MAGTVWLSASGGRWARTSPAVVLNQSTTTNHRRSDSKGSIPAWRWMHRPTLSFAPPTSASSTWPGRCGPATSRRTSSIPARRRATSSLELVPEGAEVHTAKSKTLEDIGLFAELQESGHHDALRPRHHGGPGTVRR